MRKQYYLGLCVVLPLVSTTLLTSACPMRGALDTACEPRNSSIEGCVNALWIDRWEVKSLRQAIKKFPIKGPDRRVDLLRQRTADLAAMIPLLGGATNYNNLEEDTSLPSCESSADRIEACERDIDSARKGFELVSDKQITKSFPPATLRRLKLSLRQHEAQYVDSLDHVDLASVDDPSTLCNETYASVASCKRAVDADSTALRKQVFPYYGCGRIVPGEFVTKEEPIKHPEARFVYPGITYSLDDAQCMTEDRLKQETSLLTKLRKTRKTGGKAPAAGVTVTPPEPGARP